MESNSPRSQQQLSEDVERLEARVDRLENRAFWLFLILSLIPIGLVVGMFYRVLSLWLA